MSNGKNRLFNIILVCSLAINLLLVGGIIGRLAFRPHRPPMFDHLGWVVRDLDPTTRKALRPQLRAHARKVLPLRSEIRAAQKQFENVLLQPKLNARQLDAALGKLRQASDAYQQSMHEEMVVILKRMNLRERQRFVYFLRHRPDMRHGPRHMARGYGRPPQPGGDRPPAGGGEPHPGGNQPPAGGDQPPPP